MRHTSNSRSPYMARPSHKVLLTTRIAPLIPSFVAPLSSCCQPKMVILTILSLVTSIYPYSFKPLRIG
jgi:hypothetical protein